MKKMTWRKWTARALALMLAGSMVLGGSALCGKTAYAAETNPAAIDTARKGSITIERKSAGETEADQVALTGAKFTAYKVLALGVTDGKITYTPVAGFGDAIGTNTPETLGDKTSAQLDTLADTLSKVEDKGTGIETSGDTYKLENLDLGLYLVVETQTPAGYMASKPFLVSVPMANNYNNSGNAGAATGWLYDVTAKVKNEKISLEKELAEETGNDGTVAVGDFVKYTITTTIPEYTDEYFAAKPGETAVVKFVISDTMSNGLDIQNDAEGTTNGHFVTVEVKDKGVDAATPVAPGEGNANYTLTAVPQEADTTPDLKIDFSTAYIQDHRGATVTVTYYAKVNANAVMGSTGNSNKAGLEYSNKPGTDADGNPYTEETPDPEKPEVKVYTFGIQVAKFWKDGATDTALPGAKFRLYKGSVEEANLVKNAAGQAITLTTGDTGALTFERLDEGTYFLEEVESPAGYTLLANPIKVEITAAKDSTDATKLTGGFTLKVDGTEVTATEGTFVSQLSTTAGIATIAVENHKGFSLPSTGGMGVTLFLIVGAAGIIGLSIAMTRKPKNRNK